MARIGKRYVWHHPSKVRQALIALAVCAGAILLSYIVISLSRGDFSWANTLIVQMISQRH
ncbi:MAG: hypothetical protein K9L28_03110 [Synergistales bacterium]|nr:hypothetical protein [Synergistales bacterium]